MTMLKGIQANRPRLGALNTGALGPECDPAELRALDVGYVRVHTAFPGTNMATNVASPDYVRRITEPKPPNGTGAGVKVIPYAEPGSNATADDPGLWVKWVKAWIAAYSPYCDTFEWINEPNFKEGLGSGDNAKFDRCLLLYRVVLPFFHNHVPPLKLLLSASAQLQTTAWLTRVAADNQAPPGGTIPGTSPPQSYGPGVTGRMFEGAMVASDGVCIHSYAGDVAVGTSTPSVESKFNAARAQIPSSIPIWMTEVGWGTQPPWPASAPTHAWVKTPSVQAARVDSLFDVMRLKESQGLAGIAYFIWKDYDEGYPPPHPWAGPYGLRYSPRTAIAPPPTTNAPKPSWQMFANWPASWGATTATWPTVTTTFGVTGLTQTSVTVSGTVDPNQLVTNRFFDWGLTTGYGSSSPAVPVGSGDVAVNVSYTIQGLTPGTTYQYQCRAQNSAGVGTGTNRSFTTVAPPTAPEVTTGSATNLTTSSAVLNGVVDPNGLATLAYFEYGPTTSYGSRVPASDIDVGSGFNPVPVSAPLTGLTIGATVHYRLRATNSQG